MPYIKSEDRRHYDDLIVDLCNRLRLNNSNNNSLCGSLNYIIFKIAKVITEPQYLGGERSYARFNAIGGALECCKTEISRRLVAPYEDQKIEENGDV